MRAAARDFARLGVLMRNRGMWNGRQIVSSAWVSEITRPSQTLTPGYWLQWYVEPEIKGFAAHGHLDTHLHVIPDLGLIIVRMQTKEMRGVPEGTYERDALRLIRSIVPQ